MRRRTLLGNIYSDITASLSYSEISAAGGSSSPTLKYSQTVKHPNGVTETLTTGATVTYSGSYVSSSTGVVTYNTINTSESRKAVDTVTATITLNGKTTTVSATVYQSANSVTYGDITITAFNYPTIDAGGGTSSPTLSYSQTVTNSNGTTSTVTTGATVTYSSTKGYVNSSTGVVTYNTANSTTNVVVIDTVTVTVTLNGKTATRTATVSQDAGTISENVYQSTSTSSKYAVMRTDSGNDTITSVQIYATLGRFGEEQIEVVDFTYTLNPGGQYAWYPFTSGVETGNYYVQKIVINGTEHDDWSLYMRIYCPVSNESGSIPSNYTSNENSQGGFYITNNDYDKSVVFYINM